MLFVPGYYNTTVVENSAVVPSLLRIQAVNGDLQTSGDYHYVLVSGNENAMFSLDSVTGILSAASMFDREKKQLYTLIVRASRATVSNTTTVIVRVVDVDDSPSRNGGHRVFRLNNFNGSLRAGVIGSVRVADSDVSVRHFQCTVLNNNAPGLIGVRSATCEVELLQSNPVAGTYQASIAVTDGGRVQVNSSLEVHIISLPLQSVSGSITIGLRGSAEDLLQEAKINGIVHAVRQVTAVAVTDVYLLAVMDSATTGGADVTVAIHDSRLSSGFIRPDQLLVNFTLNQQIFEQTLGANLTRLPVDPCTSNPCQNYGECRSVVQAVGNAKPTVSIDEVMYSVPIVHSYLCGCLPGTTGRQCEVALDVCYSQPCPANTLCQVSLSNAMGYVCHSITNYMLVPSTPKVLTSQPLCQCANNGSCQVTTGQCSCPMLYEGVNCGTSFLSTGNVDRCVTQPCHNGAQCSSSGATFTCRCAGSFVGKTCQQRANASSMSCDSNPCYHGATCLLTPSAPGYRCLCSPGYTGPQCTWLVQGCSSLPCQNNATCINLRNDGRFLCDCKPGYQGRTCGQLLDPCASSPCTNRGQCIATNSGYTCRCAAHFYGENCQYTTLPVFCKASVCQNSASCTEGPSGYTCHCLPGFYGWNCSGNATVTGSQSACSGNPCQHGSTCVDVVGSGYVCHCVSGFTGRDCELNVDECQSSPCSQYATCYDAVNGYVCHCPLGLFGSHCQHTCPAGTTSHNCAISVFACRPGLCQNGGSCREDPLANAGYSCSCPPLYSGTNCQTRLSCAGQPCRNGGKVSRQARWRLHMFMSEQLPRCQL